MQPASLPFLVQSAHVSQLPASLSTPYPWMYRRTFRLFGPLCFCGVVTIIFFKLQNVITPKQFSHFTVAGAGVCALFFKVMFAISVSLCFWRSGRKGNVEVFLRTRFILLRPDIMSLPL